MRVLVFAFTIVFVWTGPLTGRALGFHFQVNTASRMESSFQFAKHGQRGGNKDDRAK